MDFTPPQRSAELLGPVRELVERELFPLERAFATEGWAAVAPALEKVREKVKRRGLFAPQLPVEHGGLGLSLLEFAFLSEALGQSPLGHYAFNCQAPDVGNLELLAKFGSAEQKARFLAPLAAGRIRSCFAMTEPDHPGSNPAWLGTTAKREGEGFVIDGHKWFTSSADGAAFAIVMAVSSPERDNPYARASLFIVPTDAPGFRRVRNLPVMGEAGEGYASHAEVRFEGVRVPKEHLLGEEGHGFLLAQERLGPGRIHHCMRWLGICERAFALMCRRAVTRELSPGKPLGTRGAVQAWIAESRAEINAARLMVLQAAWAIDRDGPAAARDEISLIKFFVANVLGRVLDRAIQVHGALGLTDETPLAYWFRHERGARIYDGPDEVHQAAVAKRILRGYGLKEER